MKVISVDGIRYSVREIDVRVLGFASNCFNEHVVIPGEISGLPVRSIKPGAFANTDIKSLLLPTSMVSVHENAFRGCKLLEVVKEYTVAIGTSCVYDGIHFYDYAFADCTSLKRVSLQRELNYLTNGVFENCIALEHVNARLGKIRKNAFKNCDNLTQLKFGNQPHISSDSIENSAISCLEFDVEPILTRKILQHIIKNHIRVRCSSNVSLTSLAYQGVSVEII